MSLGESDGEGLEPRRCGCAPRQERHTKGYSYLGVLGLMSPRPSSMDGLERRSHRGAAPRLCIVAHHSTQRCLFSLMRARTSPRRWKSGTWFGRAEVINYHQMAGLEGFGVILVAWGRVWGVGFNGTPSHQTVQSGGCDYGWILIPSASEPPLMRSGGVPSSLVPW